MRFAMPGSPRKLAKVGAGSALVVATVLGFGVEALSQTQGSSPAYASNEISPAAAQARAVTVVADGKARTATSSAPTVSALLTNLGIGLHATDRVSPATSTPLTRVSSVVVTRIRYAKVVHRTKIPRHTKKRHVARLARGQHKVLRRGHPGLRRDSIRLTYVNGKLAGRKTVARKVVRHQVARVVAIGTGPSGRNASPAQAKAIAKSMLKARGWSKQFSCLETMWTHESGWNLHAHNSAGAYGIPQALPGAKMAAAGSDWANNARTQIAWGLRYIAGRYGTPCHAWSVWQTQSWY